MDISASRRTHAALRWLIRALFALTVVPIVAVTVVLPFAGRVALAFQYEVDPKALAALPLVPRALPMFIGDPLSPSTQSQDNVTPAAKVTGGGTISVENPRSITFGFVAQGQVGPGKGNVNHLNHVNGLHINGPVDTIDSITFFSPTPEGRTRGTVTFTGHDRRTGCTYTVKVTDNGEPGTTDRYGLMGCGEDTGAPGIDDSQLSTGNIQLHPTQAP